jgi:hypothetical protein
MRMVGLNPRKPDRMTHFMLRLLLDVRRQLNCFWLSATISVKSVSAIVEKLGAFYREDNSNSDTAVVAAPWFPRHQPMSNDTSVGRTSWSISTMPLRSPVPKQLWCDFHKSRGYDTKNCKAKTAAELPKSSTTASAQAVRQPAQPRFFRCNQPGHFANKCPQLCQLDVRHLHLHHHHVDFSSLLLCQNRHPLFRLRWTAC